MPENMEYLGLIIVYSSARVFKTRATNNIVISHARILSIRACVELIKVRVRGGLTPAHRRRKILFL